MLIDFEIDVSIRFSSRFVITSPSQIPPRLSVSLHYLVKYLAYFRLIVAQSATLCISRVLQWCTCADHNRDTAGSAVTERHRGPTQWHHETRVKYSRTARDVYGHGNAGREPGQLLFQMRWIFMEICGQLVLWITGIVEREFALSWLLLVRALLKFAKLIPKSNAYYANISLMVELMNS